MLKSIKNDSNQTLPHAHIKLAPLKHIRARSRGVSVEQLLYVVASILENGVKTLLRYPLDEPYLCVRWRVFVDTVIARRMTNINVNINGVLRDA